MKLTANAVNRLLILGGIFVVGLLIVSLLVWRDDPEHIPDTGSPAAPVEHADATGNSGAGGPASASNTEPNPGVNAKPDSGSSINKLTVELAGESAGKSNTESNGESGGKPQGKPGKRGKGPSVTRSASGSYIISLVDTPDNEAGGKSGGKANSKSGTGGARLNSKSSGIPTLTKSLGKTLNKTVSSAARGVVSTVSGSVNANADSQDDEESPGIIPVSTNSKLRMPVLKLEPVSIKTFRFNWADISGEAEYRLLENRNGSSAGYKQIATLAANAVSHDLEVFLPRRINARYILQACNAEGCANSAPLKVGGTLAEAVGYVKASNTGSEDRFGHSVAISGDGNTLAVGAPSEDSAARGVNGEQNSNSASASGAVYIFVRGGGNWVQQAYVKASNTLAGVEFGYSLALSDDGNTLAVGAGRENSGARRAGAEANPARPSGGVYVFIRSAGVWAEQAYVQAPNLRDRDAADSFGVAVALSGDGNILAVGAEGESSNATIINGDQDNSQAASSGAVFVFVRGGGNWTQQAYVKASNSEPGDHFGRSVSLSNNGNTLAVGAIGEDSAATGINGNQNDNAATSSGAVYVFTRGGGNWTQQAYVKASNSRPGDLLSSGDEFGSAVALSGDGNTLAVGARFETGAATGINGDQNAGANRSSGAVYVYTHSGGNWAQQAYVKASNTGWGDEFGAAVALSRNGDTLTVGAPGEDSNAAGINGDQNNDAFKSPGAVYVFTRHAGKWGQQAYVKASNNRQVPRNPEHAFGLSAALSDRGDTLAVGSPMEDGAATGISNIHNDDFAGASGAVYLY